MLHTLFGGYFGRYWGVFRRIWGDFGRHWGTFGDIQEGFLRKHSVSLLHRGYWFTHPTSYIQSFGSLSW